MIRNKKGFTLVELLVVIAIIAILISLLLPVIDRSIYTAKTITCMSNLRQWGTAITAYAADHGGKLPRYDFAGGASGTTWDVGHGFWSGSVHVNVDGVGHKKYDYGYFDTDLAQYGLSPEMYFCPLDKTDSAKNLAIRPHGSSDWMYFSYTFWLGRSGPSTSGIKPMLDADGDRSMDDKPALLMSDPNNLPVMSDCVVGPYTGSWPLDSDTTELTGFHMFRGELEGINVLFKDGRVEKRSKHEMLDRVRNPYPLHTWY